MKNLMMVDLKGQHDKIKKEIELAINKVIDSTAFINGPAVREFGSALEEYLDVKHVIPCGNGTDALQLALMASGLKPGDEVITADFTFIATAETIALSGLKPRLVDVDPKTFLIDPKKVEEAVTEKTKAIIPVHLFGQSADMDAIMDIAQRHKLIVIEDAAQSLGADHISKDGTKRKTGTIGNIGCTSFFPSKNLGGYGDGGAIFTNDDELAEKLSYLVNHGMKTRYYHDYIGMNSRLDSIQAAILKVKLKYLNGYNQARKNAADAYDKALKAEEKLSCPYRVNWSDHIFHQYTLQTKNIDRDLLLEKLLKKNIPAAIYYPVPLHRQKAYSPEAYTDSDFLNSNAHCESVISLPMHTELDGDTVEYISSKLLETIKEIS